MTNMTFTEKEVAHGNQIMWTANRLQYASNKTKLEMSTQLLDRGVLTINQVNEIWNLPPVKDGDKRYIRREYVDVDNLDKEMEGDEAIADSENEGISESDVAGTDDTTEQEN